MQKRFENCYKPEEIFFAQKRRQWSIRTLILILMCGDQQPMARGLDLAHEEVQSCLCKSYPTKWMIVTELRCAAHPLWYHVFPCCKGLGNLAADHSELWGGVRLLACSNGWVTRSIPSNKWLLSPACMQYNNNSNFIQVQMTAAEADKRRIGVKCRESPIQWSMALHYNPNQRWPVPYQ